MKPAEFYKKLESLRQKQDEVFLDGKDIMTRNQFYRMSQMRFYLEEIMEDHIKTHGEP